MFVINIFPYKNFCLVVSADDIVILKMILDRVDENCDALCLWGTYFSHASLEVHLVQRTDLSQSLPRNFIFKWRKSIESYIEVPTLLPHKIKDEEDESWAFYGGLE